MQLKVTRRYGASKNLEVETNEGKILEEKIIIDQIHKKIQEMQKLLRKGEEEAQVNMLKWENFVIQHEKMKKLREEIQETFKTN